jgi:molecular chaperone HscB
MADAFAVLGLPPRFDLSDATLDEHQRALGWALHPDRHAQSSSAERRLALSRSMDINRAVRELRDPIRRAELLLERRSPEPLPGSTAQGAKEPPPDPTLLMRVLELREELAQIRADRNGAALSALQSSVQSRSTELQAVLRTCFGDGDEALTLAQAEAARRAVSELRYLRRLGEEAQVIEDEL